jgi:tripartite motif-containing protein 71
LNRATRERILMRTRVIPKNNSATQRAAWLQILGTFIATVFVAGLVTAAGCNLCFYGPDNMAFDGEGNVFIVDTDHRSRSRVLKISKSGTKLAEFTDFHSSSSRSNGPEGIALSPTDALLVTDAGALNLVVLSPALKLLRTIGVGDTFHDLGHVAVGERGQIYVAEGEQNRIQKFTADDTRLATWQFDKGSDRNQLNMPQGLGVLPEGNLVIEDWRNRRIVVLNDSDGTPLLIFGGTGLGSARFQNTSGPFVDTHGNIYVAEKTLHRVQKFTARGEWLALIGNTDHKRLFAEGPSAIAVDEKGNLLAPDGLSIVKLSTHGQLIARWR